MKTVKFNETVTRRRHGTEQVFEEGQKYPLADDVADHYIRRGKATEVVGKAAATTKPAAKPESDTSTKDTGNGNTVDGANDVVGTDGGDSGQRPEPSGKPSGRGKGGRKRKS